MEDIQEVLNMNTTKKIVILISGRDSGKTEFQRKRLEKLIDEDLPKEKVLNVGFNKLKR